jgi:alpha-glucan, water dikinase
MKMEQIVTTQRGVKLSARICRRATELEINLEAAVTRHLLLHWGLRRPQAEVWSRPPESAWPPGTVPVGPIAVQTPFPKRNGQVNLVIHLSQPAEYAALEFVLFFTDEGRWDNNGGHNYQILLAEPPEPAVAPLVALHSRMGSGKRTCAGGVEESESESGSEDPALERVFELAPGGELAVAVSRVRERYRVHWFSDHGTDLILHWGIAQRSPHEWLLPPENCRGEGTTVYQNQAAETPFCRQGGLSMLELEFPEPEAPLGIQFVLREGRNGRWIKHRGGNFYLPIKVRQPGMARQGSVQHADIAEEIVRAETTHNSWTLMHRFNLCHDLLDRVHGSVDGLALIYVYLRFSAIRQLTWQRNYNTKPRELAHAQERLTQKLAEIYRKEPGSRPLVRLTLATVGRGGEGQRIRDEILNIMHRHHVKEVSGHFLEEWHQKLHNNTTPDDIVICEAYLAFLRNNGNLDSFYQTLEAGGVTRQRLESFERPIRSHPDFVPHLKDGLTHDFRQFLRVLKASHSGTDLETAINAARGQLDGGLQGLLNSLWEHRNDPAERMLDLVRQITDARRRLSSSFNRAAGLRELLYLDLALEQLLRAVVERNIHLRLSGDQWVDLISWVLENVTLSYEEPELAACSRHWERLQPLPRFGTTWSLHAKSVLDRVGRALSGWIDHFYALLQPKAELLGRGFQAEQWTITLFSEEVVRGNSLGFVLSILLRHLDPLLRQAAHIGNWQIISRGHGAGQVEVVEALRSIQGKRFDSPRVVVADKVTGEEEIPEGVTAVIAPDVVDIVSHVAVRARNAHVLFASCHDSGLFQHLKSLSGRQVQLDVSAGGDVLTAESMAEAPAKGPPARAPRLTVPPRAFSRYAIPLSGFGEKWVGSKACRQAQLRGNLAEWIHLPASAALPFGVFEKVLGLELNREVAKRYAELVQQTLARGTEPLRELRQTVGSLKAPEELKTALREAMAASGLAWSEDWETAWSRIKQVWASKWNERAFLSRRRVGLPDESLFMSVLIQEVVSADYAFVIHTVNPSNGNREELFAEVVLGLGETLVGNHPGRALSFVCQKTTMEQTLLSFPSKSAGLYGAGLIFRSDSSGEDLAGYAGAGLYDSVLLKTPRPVDLDYTQQPLVWDEPFRRHLLATIARIGLEVERVSGSPQDIEGTVAGNDYYVVQARPQVGLT